MEKLLYCNAANDIQKAYVNISYHWRIISQTCCYHFYQTNITHDDERAVNDGTRTPQETSANRTCSLHAVCHTTLGHLYKSGETNTRIGPCTISARTNFVSSASTKTAHKFATSDVDPWDNVMFLRYIWEVVLTAEDLLLQLLARDSIAYA